jgi:hypothetical protein
MVRPDLGPDPLSERRRAFETTVESGLVSGIISAFPTAGILALGGIFAGYGPAAPFYAIVSVLSPGALEIAREDHAAGDPVTFLQQQFIGGFGICLILGAISGVIFAIGIRKRTIRGGIRYVLGGLHGVLMMCIFYLGALQIVGAMADLEVDSLSLSTLVGWPILVLAHIAHGLVLAWVIRSRLTEQGPAFGPPAPS